MRTVGSYEAKTHLPRLLDEVLCGRTLIISRHGVPVAMLAPVPEGGRHDPGRVIAAVRAFRRGFTLRPLVQRRGRLTEAQSTRFVELLGALPIVMEQPSAGGIFNSVIPIGRRHRLSAHDAAYLELAARLGLPIATQDERVIAAAAAVGVTILHLA